MTLAKPLHGAQRMMLDDLWLDMVTFYLGVTNASEPPSNGFYLLFFGGEPFGRVDGEAADGLVADGGRKSCSGWPGVR